MARIGRRRTEPDEVRVTRMLVTGYGNGPFYVMVEPEAMHYFPPQEKVLLTFRGPATAVPEFEVSRGVDGLTIWRPSDTEV